MMLHPDPKGSGEAMEGIISLRPGWIAKAAFPALLGIIVLIGAITNWIHYPEIVKARVVFTGTNGNESVCVVDIDAPQNNGLRIDSGQSVQLQFDEYPYNEFGYTKGRLGLVRHIEGRNNLSARLYLPAGWVTDKKKQIAYRSGLKADILITINDMRLFQRVFYNSAGKRFLK